MNIHTVNIYENMIRVILYVYMQIMNYHVHYLYVHYYYLYYYLRRPKHKRITGCKTTAA